MVKSSTVQSATPKHTHPEPLPPHPSFPCTRPRPNHRTVVTDLPQNYSHPMMPLKEEALDAKHAVPFPFDARYDRHMMAYT